VKLPVDVAFRPLAQMLGNVGRTAADGGGPSADEVQIGDFAKLEQVPAVHAAFGALHAWMAREGGGRPPLPGDEAAVAAIVAATEVRRPRAGTAAGGRGRGVLSGAAGDGSCLQAGAMTP